jgi:hypothetical protein
MQSHRRRQTLESEIATRTVFLNISNSTCDSLGFLTRFPQVRSVIATNTLISDLRDVTVHSSVVSISIAGSPLAEQPFHRLTLLCSLNRSLDMIDGEAVSEEERAQASEIVMEAQFYLFKGYLLTSMGPPIVTLGPESVTLTPRSEFQPVIASPMGVLARQSAEMLADIHQAFVPRISAGSRRSSRAYSHVPLSILRPFVPLLDADSPPAAREGLLTDGEPTGAEERPALRPGEADVESATETVLQRLLLCPSHATAFESEAAQAPDRPQLAVRQLRRPRVRPAGSARAGGPGRVRARPAPGRPPPRVAESLPARRAAGAGGGERGRLRLAARKGGRAEGPTGKRASRLRARAGRWAKGRAPGFAASGGSGAEGGKRECAS